MRAQTRRLACPLPRLTNPPALLPPPSHAALSATPAPALPGRKPTTPSWAWSSPAPLVSQCCILERCIAADVANLCVCVGGWLGWGGGGFSN